MALHVAEQKPSPRLQREGSRLFRLLRLKTENANPDQTKLRHMGTVLDRANRCRDAFVFELPKRVNYLPDWLLAADAVVLAVADSAGLAQSDAGGGAGPVAQRAPEARPGEGHHRGQGQEEREREAGHVHTERVHWQLRAGEMRVGLLVVNNWIWLEREHNGEHRWLVLRSRGHVTLASGASRSVITCYGMWC